MDNTIKRMKKENLRLTFVHAHIETCMREEEGAIDDVKDFEAF